eukprot:1063964-Amphidinium_carterae.1
MTPCANFWYQKQIVRSRQKQQYLRLGKIRRCDGEFRYVHGQAKVDQVLHTRQEESARNVDSAELTALREDLRTAKAKLSSELVCNIRTLPRFLSRCLRQQSLSSLSLPAFQYVLHSA